MAITTVEEEADVIAPLDENEAEDIGLGKEEQKRRFVVLPAKG